VNSIIKSRFKELLKSLGLEDPSSNRKSLTRKGTISTTENVFSGRQRGDSKCSAQGPISRESRLAEGKEDDVFQIVKKKIKENMPTGRDEETVLRVNECERKIEELASDVKRQLWKVKEK